MSEISEVDAQQVRNDDVSWDVKVMELMQVAAALAIGGMVLLWIFGVSSIPAYAGLIIVAVACGVFPFTVKASDDASRYDGAFFEVTAIRIAGFEERKVPKDVLCALTEMKGFYGNALQLRVTFVDLVGEHRAHEYLPMLYALLRTRKRPEAQEEQGAVGERALER